MYYSIGNFFPLVERNIHEISTIDPKIVTLIEFLRAKRVTFADQQMIKKALESSELDFCERSEPHLLDIKIKRAKRARFL